MTQDQFVDVYLARVAHEIERSEDEAALAGAKHRAYLYAKHAWMHAEYAEKVTT